MKLALLGRGKTGIFVEKLSDSAISVFDSKSEISFNTLKGHDVIISFLPGDAFEKLIPLLIETKIPVVTGSTGFNWPSDIYDSLKSAGTTWIKANNFSIGMNIVKEMIEQLQVGRDLFNNYNIKIHEVHHTKKIDSPSGTAISWNEWVGGEAKITSERTGDVVGDHQLIFETEGEVIEVKHHAKDRSIFARGALWAANYIVNNKLDSGLYHFNSIVSDVIKTELKLRG